MSYRLLESLSTGSHLRAKSNQYCPDKSTWLNHHFQFLIKDSFWGIASLKWYLGTFIHTLPTFTHISFIFALKKPSPTLVLKGLRLKKLIKFICSTFETRTDSASIRQHMLKDSCIQLTAYDTIMLRATMRNSC